MPPPEYVPVRPRSGQGTSVSCPTSATDGAKGMTIPLVRPGLPVTHPALSSAIQAMTTSTNSVNGPHRPLQHLANAPQEQSSGPRRILIPDRAVQRQRVNSTSTRSEGFLTKSTPSDSKGTKSHTTIAIPSKPKPSVKAPAAQSSDKVLPEKAPRVRGVTQPTLSQMSRAKATAKEKGSAAAPPKPNTWGRQPPQNGKKPIQPGLIRHPVPKATAKALPRPVSRNAGVRPVTPAQIPLPPSPSPAIEAEGTVTEPPTPSASMKLPMDADGSAKDQSAHCSTSSSPRTINDTALTHVPCTDVIEPEVVAAECPQEEDQDNHVVVQTSELEETSPLPASAVSGSSTPRTLLLPQDTTDCSHKTPISALLSSIQRGFLFTPSSPLSPPESYLEKCPNSLPDPFPLTMQQPQCTEDAKLTQSKGPFMFGIGVGELERTTLGSVENLNI